MYFKGILCFIIKDLSEKRQAKLYGVIHAGVREDFHIDCWLERKR